MRIHRNILSVVGLLGVAAGPATAAPAVPAAPAATADSRTEAVKKEIWAKELSIYAGRGEGKLDFYIDNTSSQYLSWPPTVSAPMPLSTLQRDGAAMRGKEKEKIDTQFKGFTLSGETAVIYYVNHRTMKADGTPVNQYFENIHVWVHENGAWKVLGGMSRLVQPPAG
jgi:hypothetical protein